MNIKNATFEGLKSYVKETGKRIICFGVGSVFLAWFPYLLERYDLKECLAFCLDNDPYKWDTEIEVAGRKYWIRNPEYIRNIDCREYVLLITSRYFSSIIEQLDMVDETEELDCFVADIMQITHEPCQDVQELSIDNADKIPKIIHYCWFGDKKMSDHDKRCIESWHKFCKDYIFMKWSEENYDFSVNAYMNQSYKMKKFGYTPDYLRIDVLHRYGGFYFDTDVMMLRSIDPLRKNQAFCSFEEYPIINFGGGSGAVKGHPMLKKILDFRKDAVFDYGNGRFNNTSCGLYETTPLLREGLRLDGTYQVINGLTVYPYSYFHSKSSVTGEIRITPKAYSVHDFNWSWIDGEKKREMEENHRKNREWIKKLGDIDENGEPISQYSSSSI